MAMALPNFVPAHRYYQCDECNTAEHPTTFSPALGKCMCVYCLEILRTSRDHASRVQYVLFWHERQEATEYAGRRLKLDQWLAAGEKEKKTLFN